MSAARPSDTLPRLAFRLPLDPARLRRVRDRIRDYLHGLGCPSETIADVVLAAEEAMANAVRHSGAADELEISLAFDGRDLIAEITDHGRGFDASRLDLARPPDPTAPGGRGLFLMAALLDELQVQGNGGVAITAVKRNARREPARGYAKRRWLAPAEAIYHDARNVALLEEIDEAVVAYDWEYRYVHLNAAALRHAGRKREQLIGHSAWQAHPEAQDMPQGIALREAMELGRFAILEYHVPTSGDWVETRFYPTTFGVTVVSREINERKRKEFEREELLEAVRDGEARLALASRAGAIGLYEWTSDAAYWGNPEAYKLFGLDPEMPVTFERWLACVHPDDRERLAGRMAELVRLAAARDEEFVDRDEYRIVHSDGSVRWLEAVNRLERQGSQAVFRGTVCDVTERRRIEEALRASEASHRDFFETLQEGLVHPLPVIAGLELAMRSLPAHSPALVGGDFCDVFRLPDERVLVVIGDVVGKGMRAAALAETVHSALRAFATIDGDPGFVLGKTNDLLLAGEPDDAYVTVLVVVLDLDSGEARLASAGHPGPIRIGGDLSQMVEPLYGPPLGSFAARYPTTTLLLEHGQTLVLFTDGVTEARSDDMLFGEERALGTVSVLADESVQDIADALASAARSFSDELRDDLEVLVLRWP